MEQAGVTRSFTSKAVSGDSGGTDGLWHLMLPSQDFPKSRFKDQEKVRMAVHEIFLRISFNCFFFLFYISSRLCFYLFLCLLKLLLYIYICYNTS